MLDLNQGLLGGFDIGGGQPGSMRIEDDGGHAAELPYPAYARRTGFPTHHRCRTCVDAAAELADFACGDAWIPRFLQSGRGWSILLTRSEAADNVIAEMVKSGELNTDLVTIDEVLISQKGNLASKKYRQGAKRRLYVRLGLALPQYDGGFLDACGGHHDSPKIQIQALWRRILL